ncbi:MAG: trypsin-like peptidase domain-containing protein [Prolixibacteraceae bacterium]|nr:trypsin-like peptidase domain-containing protein [Burkholderiales bacterium]
MNFVRFLLFRGKLGKLLVAALSGVLACANPGFAVDRDLFIKLSTSVLKVEAFNPDGSISIGSGVMVAEGAVATNCHVTHRARRIELIKSGLRWAVQSQSSNVRHDLCLLYSRHANVPVVAMNSSKLKPGQAVTAVGFIGGHGPRFSGGQVKALHDYDKGMVIQSSTPFNSGASGGGLFDEDGRLVGIATFKARRARDDYHFSLPIQWIIDQLEADHAIPVGPLSADEPFWQQKDEQPFFLRALTMEASGNWKGLLDVSGDWARAEPASAHSWVSIGKAHFHLDQYDAAIAAYRKATAIDAQDAEAWFQLGLAFADKGENSEVREVHMVLRSIDPDLAEQLADAALR